MQTKLLHLLAAATLSAGLLTTAARADSVTLTLTPSAETVAPGGVATYTATIFAPSTNALPVYLNSDTITFNGPTDIAIDDSDLFNFPVDLAPGASASDPLFTLTVPSTETLGD